MYNYVKTKKDNSNLSIRAYNLVIGGILLWGFVVNIIMCTFFADIFVSWNTVSVIVMYFILTFAGILICKFSEKPIVSFIGYNMVIISVGVILSIALSQYSQISIMNALIVTLAVTMTMIILASIMPNVFLSMRRVLFACLLGVIIFEIIFMLFGIYMPSVWDFGIALIFCGYIGYDWAKAQEKEYTLYNAIDSVVELYLDIVNLFIRVLAGGSKVSKD